MDQELFFWLELIKVEDKWLLLIQLTRINHLGMHWIYLSQGVMYNENFNNTMMKSIYGLDLYTLLGVPQ